MFRICPVSFGIICLRNRTGNGSRTQVDHFNLEISKIRLSKCLSELGNNVVYRVMELFGCKIHRLRLYFKIVTINKVIATTFVVYESFCGGLIPSSVLNKDLWLCLVSSVRVQRGCRGSQEALLPC